MYLLPSPEVNQPLTVLADSCAIKAQKHTLPPADFDPFILLHYVPHLEQESLEGGSVLLINLSESKVCFQKYCMASRTHVTPIIQRVEDCFKHKISGSEIGKASGYMMYT